MSLRLRDDLPDETGLMGRLPEHVRSRIPIQRVPQPRENRMTASWRQAKPGRIAAALAVSQAQNSGGWFVAGQSADVGATESVARTIAGREVVFWRDADGTLIAGPGACPHLGALMDACPVLDGTMYCRWHGTGADVEGRPDLEPVRGPGRRSADLGPAGHRG